MLKLPNQRTKGPEYYTKVSTQTGNKASED